MQRGQRLRSGGSGGSGGSRRDRSWICPGRTDTLTAITQRICGCCRRRRCPSCSLFVTIRHSVKRHGHTTSDLRHSPGRGGDGDDVPMPSVASVTFDAISWRKKCVETLNEGWMASEKGGYAINYAGGVDAKNESSVYTRLEKLYQTHICPLNSFMTSKNRLYTSGLF